MVDHEGYFQCRLCAGKYIDGDYHDVCRHFNGKRHKEREEAVRKVVPIDGASQTETVNESVLHCLTAFFQCGMGSVLFRGRKKIFLGINPLFIQGLIPFFSDCGN